MSDIGKKIGMAISVGLVSIRSIRKKTVCVANDRILIVADGGMGDAFVDGQALIEMVNYFGGLGKEIYLVCEAPAWKTLQLVADMSKVHFIQHDFSGNAEGKSSPQRVEKTRETLKKLKFDDVYVLFNGGSEVFCVAADVHAARRTTVLYDEKNDSFKRKIRNAFIWKHIENILTVPQECTHSERSRKLALLAGVPTYPLHILHIPELKNASDSQEKKYITVAVDSTSFWRRWEVKNFIELIKWLLERFEYDVIITGSYLNEMQIEQYDEVFLGCEHVQNVVGKQSLDEWIEILRGSQFHIGVDSGSIHVAAAVGTQSFCLAGKWDGEKFFPYKLDETASGTANPICIYRSDVPTDTLVCAFCKSRGGYGVGNPECRKAYKDGKPCLCLQKITVDDVISAIEKARQDGMIS